MTKQLLLTLILSFIFLGRSSAQCDETNQDKVMLVGDSWAFFMGADGTFNTVFDRWGHSNYKFYTNAIISENGAETDDFLTATKQNEIAAQLANRPEIEAVHLSLGGNDVLGSWNVDFTQYQTDSLIDTVMSRLLTIVDFIKASRPGIRVVWSGYTYPNFGQVIEDAGILQTIHPFYGTWQGMGFPTFIQLNEILNDVSLIVEAYAASDPQVDFVNATGIVQHTYGQATPLSVPPGGSYAPFQAPLPEGYPEYPSPKASMRNYAVFTDCFHLSIVGYQDFINYQTQKFYHKFLMDDEYFLALDDASAGATSSAGNVFPEELRLGQLNGEEFRPIMTFNTTSLPNAGVSSASLFIRRESIVLANPLEGGLKVKINSGSFGGSFDLEVSDFDAAANATTTPCVFGSSNNDGRWVRIELPASALSLINNSSPTQIMLVDPNPGQGYITFSNASDPDFAPVLSVNHNSVTGIETATVQPNDIFVYPNPTSGHVFIKSNAGKINRVDVLNTQGQVVQQSTSTTSVELGALPGGMYLLKISSDEGYAIKRVLKQ